MDVREESVGLPASLFLDCDFVSSVEVEGHCPSCLEGMATDLLWWNALFVQVEFASMAAVMVLEVTCFIWPLGSTKVERVVEGSWVAFHNMCTCRARL